MTLHFDHLAIGAQTLAEGEDWVESVLGVAMGPGGVHPRMGTHNRLLKVGPRRYLEVIAVDPAAEAPTRPRWFGLDTPPARPRILGWVARCVDIAAVAARSPLPLGTPEAMSRGALSWQITIAADGRPPAGGALPSLIEWPEGVHPADGMAETGVSLVALTIAHPEPVRIEAALAAMDWQAEGGLVQVSQGERVALSASFLTPRGPVRLGP
ncbi:VOC family protein [Humitalea sp. 24SJ18S-53]|uniref:VOC family protein n=1 Tax=Humitalea sp. 24SJ18S-53 TaxID=3422307 RepID=UPI003D66CFE6